MAKSQLNPAITRGKLSFHRNSEWTFCSHDGRRAVRLERDPSPVSAKLDPLENPSSTSAFITQAGVPIVPIRAVMPVIVGFSRMRRMDIPASTRTVLRKRYRTAIVRAVACSMLLALPACRIPKLAQAEGGPLLPAGFTGVNGSGTGATPRQLATGAGLGSAALAGWVAKDGSAADSVASDSSAQLGVEEFYSDPILTRLIQQGVLGNRELKMLDQEVQIANNEVLARRGAYLPLVTVGAGAGLDKSSRFTRDGAVEDQLTVAPGQPFPIPLPMYRMGLDFTWRLDIWRALRNARDAAEQRYLAAVERRNAFVTRLVADIAENYYRLVALDQRLETLDNTIQLQQQSLDVSKALKEAGRITELPVQRFQAEVRRNQSEKLIVAQDIVEAENRINFLVNRYPEPVDRIFTKTFFDLNIHPLSAGVPSQLLRNRPDIRQAERELIAAGLELKSVRARFYPDLTITAGIGYQAFNPAYLFTNPEALIANVAGGLVAPLVNKRAIQADYLSANARQLESLYNYQRVVLNAFTEVINRLSMVENYRKSLEIKKLQLEALVTSVDIASKLFQNARAEYVEVLLAQRDLQEARMTLIQVKMQQLSAVVNAYQALGGGNGYSMLPRPQLIFGAPARPTLFERLHRGFPRHSSLEGSR
jgi:multidrug efflux system outer membrane protein